jgi:hypothetical protein
MRCALVASPAIESEKAVTIVGDVPNTDVRHGTSAALPSFDDRDFEATITKRGLAIYLGSRRFYVGMENARYRFSRGQGHAPSDPRESSGIWRRMGYAGSGLLLFCLIFASANMLRASAPASQYSVVIPIPENTASVDPRHSAHARRLARVRIGEPRLPRVEADNAGASLADPQPARSDGDISVGQPDHDADIEDLPAKDGERALEVYGPRRQVGNKSCRDASVFVRGTDGKVSMSPVVRCEPQR